MNTGGTLGPAGHTQCERAVLRPGLHPVSAGRKLPSFAYQICLYQCMLALESG